MSTQKLVIASIGASLVACATGCVEASVHEKTARELAASMRAGEYKDRQIHVLEWQVASMAQALRDAAAREAALHEAASRLTQASQAYAACEEQRKRDEGERRELAASLAAAEAASKPGARGRTDDLRRLVASLDAQNARIVERLGRLEQKIDARAAEDRNAGRRPAKPFTMGETPKPPARPVADPEVVDPWGFGARK